MLHDAKTFDEVIARTVEEPVAKPKKARAKRQAKVPAQPKAPDPRAHRETGRVCDCTAHRYDLITFR